jgi:hypothetical protein
MSTLSQALVAHACSPSYSGGRDQKDGGSKLAQANSSQVPISKNLITEKELVEWLKVGLSSNPSTTKKKKKKRKKKSTLMTLRMSTSFGFCSWKCFGF